jgi:hypothetical protein
MIEPPDGLTASDFDAIEAAVMETARGRWFLAEYARQCRADDTMRSLRAIERLEASYTRIRDEEARIAASAERAAAAVRQFLEFLRAGAGAEPSAVASTPEIVDARDHPALAAATRSAGPGSLEARLAALAEIDRLPPAEKQELFR